MGDEADKRDAAELDATDAAGAKDGGQDGAPSGMPPVCDPALLTLLVCPFTRTTLGYVAARQELISQPERLAFPIRDGIPILVREEARNLDDTP